VEEIVADTAVEMRSSDSSRGFACMKNHVRRAYCAKTLLRAGRGRFAHKQKRALALQGTPGPARGLYCPPARALLWSSPRQVGWQERPPPALGGAPHLCSAQHSILPAACHQDGRPGKHQSVAFLKWIHLHAQDLAGGCSQGLLPWLSQKFHRPESEALEPRWPTQARLAQSGTRHPRQDCDPHASQHGSAFAACPG
jgi:hypothetical protein